MSAAPLNTPPTPNPPITPDKVAVVPTDPPGGRQARWVDTGQSDRIPAILETVRELSTARSPNDVLTSFARWRYRQSHDDGYISVSTRGLPPGQYKITRQLLIKDEDAFANPSSPWDLWDQLPTHTGGILGQIIDAARPQIIQNLDLSADPVIGKMMGAMRSLIAMPLFDQGQPLNWAIPLRLDPNAYTLDELEEMLLRGNLVGATIKNTLVSRQLEEANAKLEREVQRIAAIQHALLPSPLPQVPGLQIAADYRTHGQAGGDLYDIVPLRGDADPNPALDPNRNWVIMIADASGHGPAAATVSAMTHAFLRAYVRQPGGAAQLLCRLNTHLCASSIESSFVTAFLAVYDPQALTLTYASAGHPPPLLRRPGNDLDITRLDGAGSFPLGIVPDAQFDEATVTLTPGESVILYTDGITEALAPDGSQFGVRGIEQALSHCNGEAACTVRTLTEALLRHENGVRPSDDQTLLALRAQAPTPAPPS